LNPRRVASETILVEAVKLARGSADQAVVLGVVANPEPQDPAFDIDAERAVMKAYSARPKAAHTLERREG